MFNTKFGIGALIAVAILAALLVYQHQGRLRQENESLRQQLAERAKWLADNQRLSNLLSQAKAAQTGANEQFQELLRLRSEVSRLTHDSEETNRVTQARMAQALSDQLRELTSLRTEVGGLSEEVGDLREAVEELYSSAPAAPSAASAEERTSEASASANTRSGGRNSSSASTGGSDRAMSVRMINTRPETFAEKLKRTAAAQDGETFQEVFGRFLQSNGVDLNNVAGLVFDERSGRVIVRATGPALDQIERLTVALDGSQ